MTCYLFGWRRSQQRETLLGRGQLQPVPVRHDTRFNTAVRRHTLEAKGVKERPNQAHSQARVLVRHRLHPQRGQREDVMSGELRKETHESIMHTFKTRPGVFTSQISLVNAEHAKNTGDSFFFFFIKRHAGRRFITNKRDSDNHVKTHTGCTVHDKRTTMSELISVLSYDTSFYTTAINQFSMLIGGKIRALNSSDPKDLYSSV